MIKYKNNLKFDMKRKNNNQNNMINWYNKYKNKNNKIMIYNKKLII